jgi:hypothetical protein
MSMLHVASCVWRIIRACITSPLARQARLKANLNYPQRFLLAEIIKTSKVSIDTLLGIIREEQIQPIWDEILLPPGKSFRTRI